MKIKKILQLSAFLLFGYCNISAALGISEIVIQSQLGEPLAALINISDVEKTPDASCFTLKDLNSPPAFSSSKIAVKHQPNGYQLIISTHEAITDPILNLHLSHHCEPNVTRDYIALLDPPNSTLKAATDNAEQSANSASTETIPASSSQQQAAVISNTAPKHATAKSSSGKKKSSAKTASLDEKLTAIYTGTPQAVPAASSTQGAELKSKPQLKISGGDLAPDTTHLLPQPALRLETQIDFSRAEQAAPLSTTDVMDEITAMDNRLALLKSQIISLQNQNEKLKTDAEHAKLQMEDTISTLRIAAGLIALLALIEWLRRWLMQQRLARNKDNWFDSHQDDTDAEVSSTANVSMSNNDHAKDSSFNDVFDEKSDYDISAGFGTSHIGSLTASAMQGHDEDILESIDVLIEYARYGLAIQLLHDYLASHPTESPKVWLKLLSLIAEHGTEAEYTQTLGKCSQYYRIKMPNFAEAGKAGSVTLEDFPFITRELESVWGSAAALVLLDDLIYNREAQPEEGFEPEIFEQLLLLKQIAENRDTEPAASSHAVTADAEQHHLQTYAADSDNQSTQNMTANDSTAAQQYTETATDAVAAHVDHAESQQPAADEALPILNFDDYFTQPAAAARIDDDSVSDTERLNPATLDTETLPDFDEKFDFPEIKPALNAPEIDFTQHFEEVKKVDDTQNISATSSEQADAKPQKRVVKDSNLIDWIITDET